MRYNTRNMETKSKKAHFIGICGVGMSAVAKLLKDSGWEITGSDDGFYPPISDYLVAIGIPFAVGYKSENIPDDVDMIVIGKNAKLVPDTNEEVRYALELGVDVKSFPQVLQEITDGAHNIICAGSHGKSTCSSLMAWCLHNTGKDPSFFIGAIPFNFETTSHLGGGEVFVLEGDEYPSANDDDTSKFMYYNATDVLITSVEHDHVNVFKTQEDFSRPFINLISTLPEEGLLVINNSDEQAEKIIPYSNVRTVTYSVDGKSDWTAENISFGETTSFDLMYRGKLVVGLSTSAIGKHNVENIVGVSAMLLEKKLLNKEELVSGIETYSGIVRRLDKKTKASKVLVYEGFGSSYKKAEAAIAAMKLHFPDKKLVVVFEPHTFSWRNRDYIHHYDTIFNGVDRVYIYKPAEQGSGTHAQLTQEEIVGRVRSAGIDVDYIKDEKEGLEIIDKEVKDGDVVLLLTSGNLDGMVQSIPKLLDEKFRN